MDNEDGNNDVQEPRHEHRKDDVTQRREKNNTSLEGTSWKGTFHRATAISPVVCLFTARRAARSTRTCTPRTK